MLVITDLRDNKYHGIQSSGAYEWWYFDGIDDKDEYSFTVVFLTGNPFSQEYTAKIKNNLKQTGIMKPDPLNYCAVSFNLYLENRPVYRILYEYEKENFSAVKENGEDKIIMDKSSFYYDKTVNKFYLNLNLSAADLDNKFKAEFIFSVKSDPSELNKGMSENKGHFWLPAAMVCDVEGKFKFYKDFKRRKTEFTGLGYHDQNWGTEAMFINIKDWYRGRIITNEYSIIYFYVLYDEMYSKPFKKFLIYRNGILELERDDFDIKIKNKNNYLLMNFNNEVTIESDGYKLISKNESKIDNGPFYSRFLSKNDFFVNNKKVMNDMTGISENIRPKKIKTGLFKTFIGTKKAKNQ